MLLAGPEAIVPESHLRHGEFRRVSPDQVQVLATGTGPLGGPGIDALLNLPATTGDVVPVTLNLFGDFEIDGANYFFDVVLGNSPLADLNRNGTIDVNDVDLLATAIRIGDTQLRFDLNADSRVNDDDQRFWVKTWPLRIMVMRTSTASLTATTLCSLPGGQVRDRQRRWLGRRRLERRRRLRQRRLCHCLRRWRLRAGTEDGCGGGAGVGAWTLLVIGLVLWFFGRRTCAT